MFKEYDEYDDNYEECYFCEGKGYLRECPVDMGDDSRAAHSNCAFCGGDYYGEFICPECNGSGKA